MNNNYIYITYPYRLKLTVVLKNLYLKPFSGQLMVLATLSPSIMAISLMSVATIPRSVMSYKLPRIVELVLQPQQCKLQVQRIITQFLVSFVSMELLLKFGSLIIPCSGFQFSSVIGLTVRTTSKLKSLGLHQLTSPRWRINMIFSFQYPKISKFSMFKTELIQDGKLFC